MPLSAHLCPALYGGTQAAPSGIQEVLPATLSPSNPLPQAKNITSETDRYEDQEQQLMIDCVEQFCTYGSGVCRHCRWGWGRSPAVTDPGPPTAEASQQVVHLSEELDHRAEDVARKQEEITQLLAQVAELQQKCRTVRVPCPCRGEGDADTAL